MAGYHFLITGILKPEANIPIDINLAGLKFYRTFELQGKQKDTLIFSDIVSQNDCYPW